MSIFSDVSAIRNDVSHIRATDDAILAVIKQTSAAMQTCCDKELALLQKIADLLTPPPEENVTGIGIEVGPVTPRKE
jgi:class 3 adenylate cyclase